MRDPIFYRWHAYVDDIFQLHKATLAPYTKEQLNFAGVTVSAIQVQAEGGRPNIFSTNWQQSDLDLSKGMDFAPRGDVFARFTHLVSFALTICNFQLTWNYFQQHKPYTITIQVNNNSGTATTGMVRVFLAPKFDATGRAMSFKDQRVMMIELDKFQAPCKLQLNFII